MAEHWGSFELWKEDFINTGKTRSIGWAICALDPLTGDINNHFVQLHEDGNVPGYHPIVVMDVWEHAYMVDHAASGRADYINAFFSNVSWDIVEKRFAEAQKKKHQSVIKKMWSKLFIVTSVIGGSWAGLLPVDDVARAMDNEIRMEVRRLDQNMSDLNNKMESILREIRGMQRDVERIGKESTIASKNATEAVDGLTRIQNTDIANLVAVDKQIAQRFSAMAKLIEEQTPIWNWGSQLRTCADVGKHQQIQTVRSADGQFSLRYLCFDGRAMHLGTEVNLPPQ